MTIAWTTAISSLVWLQTSADAATSFQPDPQRAPQAAALAQPLIDRQITPGLVIGLIEDGERLVIPLGSTSYDAHTPPDADTVYEIGSISKVFTAVLLADAQARGELHEQDTLASHAPEPLSLQELNPDNPIRLLHLSAHASGLPRMPNNISPADMTNPYADYTDDLLWEFVGQVTPEREPEAGYEYSNLAAGLLGTVVAANANASYEQLILSRIAEPLGLTSTTVLLNDEHLARLAPPHLGTNPTHNWDFDALAGCGAIRSTVTDMLTFAQATLDAREHDGGEPDAGQEGPGSLALALRSVQDRRFEPGGSSMDVALGWHLAGPTNRIIWHNGGTGGYSTFLAVNTLNKTAVVVLANGSSQDITTLGFEIVRALSQPAPADKPDADSP